MSPYYASCLDPHAEEWTLAAHLDSWQACIDYCLVYGCWAPEIRIYDPAGVCVMRFTDGVLTLTDPHGEPCRVPLKMTF